MKVIKHTKYTTDAQVALVVAKVKQLKPKAQSVVIHSTGYVVVAGVQLFHLEDLEP